MGRQIQAANVLYPELSYSIIGAAMDVHNGLGPGWDEWDYQRAMINALEAKGHTVSSHQRKSLVHRGVAVDHFEFDLLVNDLIVLELKHIKSDFHPEHFTQIINYLKRWEKRLGILVNYGLERLVYQRVPFDPVVGQVHVSGKWKELGDRVPDLCDLVLRAVQGILDLHGYGYGVGVFQNLLMSELDSLGATAILPCVTPAYGSMTFESRPVNCVLVNSGLIVCVTATKQGSSSADLAYLKSYMRQMDVSYGMLIDIGNPDVQLKGVL